MNDIPTQQFIEKQSTCINVLTWNIEGLSKHTENNEIKAYIRQFDIIALCETWCNKFDEFDPFLDGYTHFGNVREMQRNHIRNSGGVSVFIRNELVKKNLIERIYSHFKNCVVILFKGSNFDNMRDIILYFAYVSPEGSPIYANNYEKDGIKLIDDNFTDIISDYPDAYYILGGDLNARTKDFIDYIPSDDLDYIFGETDYEGDDFDLPRSNKDMLRYNLHDMHIINGRLHDDLEGNYTCIANNGASTVDYSICSTALFGKCTQFNIENRTESDHFPLKCQFKFEKNVQATENMQNDTTFTQTKYKWSNDKAAEFLDTFRNLYQNIKDEICQIARQDIDKSIKMMTDTYHTAASSMKVKGHKGKQFKDLHPPWWDTECDKIKQTKYAALRRFRNTNTAVDLQVYKDIRSSFKNTCKRKKEQYLSQQRKKLIDNRSHPKYFWQILKANNKKESPESSISGNEWRNYFSDVLRNDDNYMLPDENEEIDILDDATDMLNIPITENEVSNSIKNLIKGKSPGTDGLSVEFYKQTLLDIVPTLTLIFNVIFDTGKIPYSWGESIICPIHKSGSKNDPNNYRGISLLNTMYKIMSNIVNQRLYTWAEENNKIDEGQAGFRRGYSTVDNIFTLQAMVQKYLSKTGGRFYCIYIDFRKAFDKIRHDVLFRSMKQKGIDGKIFRFLLTSYSKLKSCVRTEHGLTDFFPCTIGTRQGDISSPVIFSLFINDLCTLLREKGGRGIFISNSIPEILCLMFADDVASCSDTAIQLQRQINIIESFCTNTGMELNLNKTEIIVFRRGGYLRNYEKWTYKGNRIKTTSIYKYMGLLFTPMLSWTSAKIKLAAQAQKAIFSIQNYQRTFGYLQHSETFKLFDAIVKPVLCYASEIWGYEYSDIIESVQAGFCKRFLGINSSTNNCMALGECGRLPLNVTYQTNCIKYWCKLLQMQDSRYPKQPYEMLKSLDDVGRITWATKIKMLLFQYGFGYVWITQNIGDADIFVTQFKQRLSDCGKQTWHDSVQNSSRCDFYKEFKSLLNPERYLCIDLNFPLRKALARFRCSSHKLMIETGRHQNIPREERICTYCQESRNERTIENEYHVFYVCHKYDEVRTQFLRPWYDRGDREHDLINLMQITDHRKLKRLAKFIFHLLQKVE